MEANEQFFFKMEDQWNVVHFPERPNGFAILIIGDTNHYVDQQTSLWIQHVGRNKWIKEFTAKGYVVFYSNLFGRHWGNPKVITFLKGLCHIVLRQYILNERIHIFAEGMGALVALELMEKMKDDIRSVALVNPCLDIKKQFTSEKNNQLFFKRFIKEMAEAYEKPKQEVVDSVINHFDLEDYRSDVPVKIWHATDNKSYEVKDHSREYEGLRQKQGSPIELVLNLTETQYSYSKDIIDFFSKHEKIL